MANQFSAAKIKLSEEERASTAHADGNTVIHDWPNTLDEVGNLLLRNRFDVVADTVSSEGFTYDTLNRVTGESIALGGPVNPRTSNTHETPASGLQVGPSTPEIL